MQQQAADAHAMAWRRTRPLSSRSLSLSICCALSKPDRVPADPRPFAAGSYACLPPLSLLHKAAMNFLMPTPRAARDTCWLRTIPAGMSPCSSPCCWGRFSTGLSPAGGKGLLLAALRLADNSLQCASSIDVGLPCPAGRQPAALQFCSSAGAGADPRACASWYACFADTTKLGGGNLLRAACCSEMSQMCGSS